MFPREGGRVLATLGARIPYRIPSDHVLPERLPPVLAVLYPIFNEGYAATATTFWCAVIVP